MKALLAALLLLPLAVIAADPARPNIVFIFADDLAWGDAPSSIAGGAPRFSTHLGPRKCEAARFAYSKTEPPLQRVDRASRR
jgi:hypothetical protein